MILTKLKNQSEQYSDLEVIHKVKNEEADFFELLIRRYNSLLYKTGRAYGYNHHDTEDLMQETYISAYCNIAQFGNRSSFKTWLLKIMLNHCYQKKQKLNFKNELSVDNIYPEKSKLMFHHPIDIEKLTAGKELGKVIEKSLTKIPEDYRIVFALHKLNGLSIAETAEIMNITTVNAKVKMNRAKKMLRTEIEKIYSPQEIFEFNLMYCDNIVHKVMSRIKSMENKM